MTLQILQHSKRIGEKLYRYYSIAEPYREDGKNKKRVLAHLGNLSDEQVEHIRMALKLANNSDLKLIDTKSIICSATFDFLLLSVFHHLFKEIGFDKAVGEGTGEVSLSNLLEILVLNRIAEPMSKSAVAHWYPHTALPDILGVKSTSINETRIYRSLTEISDSQIKIEKFIFERLIKLNQLASSSIYFYDLSSSYFEGNEVELGAFNVNSKDHRPDKLQVVLGLLIDQDGLPFSWDIMKGNQADAPTLIAQLEKFKERFKINCGTLVFDRGFLSAENLETIEKAGYHYVTGLKSLQIDHLLIVHPQNWLSKITTNNVQEVIAKQSQWQRFDETGYYCSLGNINNKKTILLFDTARFKLAGYRRQEKIENFKDWVHRYNERLAKYKKDAKREVLARELDEEIKDRELTDYISYDIREDITLVESFDAQKNNLNPSHGHHKRVKTFCIELIENNRNIHDGLFALVTTPKSPLTELEMVQAYRQKYLIENAFREMKSVLKLRPWFVYKLEHIKAHYTICVLAYLLERIIDIRLKQQKLDHDGWTLGKFKDAINKIRQVEIQYGKDTRQKSIQKVPKELERVITQLNLKNSLKITTH